jgi:predicted amidophosphoribosyltransferase
MNPLVIYIGALVVIGVFCVGALFVYRGPTRVCPRCDTRVSLFSRVCRWCGYRFVTSTLDTRRSGGSARGPKFYERFTKLL